MVACGFIAVCADGTGTKQTKQRLAMLDPSLFDDMQTKIAVASLAGKESFVARAYKEMLDEEVLALFEAGEDLGIFHCDADIRDKFIHHMQAFVSDTVGFAASR